MQIRVTDLQTLIVSQDEVRVRSGVQAARTDQESPELH